MGIFSPPYLSLLDLAHHQCDRPKMRPLECEPATHCVARFASGGSKGSPLECEPATHCVLRFASAGSKGSTDALNTLIIPYGFALCHWSERSETVRTRVTSSKNTLNQAAQFCSSPQFHECLSNWV